MYIEQLQKIRMNLWTYAVIPCLFLALMIFNYVSSEGVDTNQLMKQMTKEIGVNGTFVMLVAPLSFMLFFVLFYNKFIQNNSLRVLTTSRPKIDWSRFFFSFGVCGGITIITTLIGYFTTQ